MALRDQPYLPLYVQDYLTDEKLSMCAWATQGIYIKILCLLHKSEPYGSILLKQNDKQSENIALNFATKITKLLPIERDTLYEAINQLVEEGCLSIEGDKLFQKRMVRDNDISIERAKAGKEGGLRTQFAKAKLKAKDKANTEYENEDVNEDDNNSNRRIKKFVKPTLEEVEKYFFENGYKPEIGKKAWMGYDTANWFDSKGQQIKNWKQKMINVWFRDEHKITKSEMVY